MAQNKGILSLLDDDDDDEDLDEDVGGSRPTASPQQAPWTQSAAFPKGSLPRLPPLQGAQQQPHPQKAAPSTSRPASGPQINLQKLLDFCKQKFPPEEYKAIVTDFLGFKAQKIDSREMLAKIRARIGPDIIQQFSAQIRSLAANGQGTQAQHQQHQQQGRQGGQPQQVTQHQQPGSSIMQSLKYNAEQSRQQRPGSLPPDVQPAFSRPAQPAPEGLRAFPQHMIQSGVSSQPVIAANTNQHRPQFPVSAAPTASAQPVEVPPQARPVLPSFLGKQPEANQQTQPAAKRAKKDKEDIDDENDILKDSGINLEEEQNALLGNLKGTTEASVLPKAQPAVSETTFLNLSPLQVKILDIAKRHGLESVDQQVGVLISEALETHLGALIKQIFAMARQRTDTDRTRPGMVLTGNVRKKLHEINARNSEKQREQDLEAAEIQQAATTKRKQAEESKKSEKANLKDSDKQQVSAANAAAAAAFGSKAQKWGAWSTSAAKNPTAASQPSAAAAAKSEPAASDTHAGLSEKPTDLKREESEANRQNTGGRPPDGAPKSSFLPPSRVKAEMLSARLPDLIAVMENHYMYQKSGLLYKLYDQTD